MRESLGGLFLIKIMVVFIVLYNVLLAIAVNYTMAFKVKNEIIDLLEQYEGCANAEEAIRNYVSKVGYYRNLPTGENGYTIEAFPDDNRNGTQYRVTTYLNFGFPKIPFVRNITGGFRFEITGESKLLYGVKETGGVCESLSQ